MNEIEYKIKHLEMIQTIINRLSSISVTVKGCSITLMAAYLALATSKSEFKNIVVPISIGVMFWIIDSAYLYKERQYRKYYETVCSKRHSEIDFKMEIVLTRKQKAQELIKAMFSAFEIGFYGLLILISLSIFLSPDIVLKVLWKTISS